MHLIAPWMLKVKTCDDISALDGPLQSSKNSGDLRLWTRNTGSVLCKCCAA